MSSLADQATSKQAKVSHIPLIWILDRCYISHNWLILTEIHYIQNSVSLLDHYSELQAVTLISHLASLPSLVWLGLSALFRTLCLLWLVKNDHVSWILVSDWSGLPHCRPATKCKMPFVHNIVHPHKSAPFLLNCLVFRGALNWSLKLQ